MSEIADSPPASGIDISAAPKQGSRVAKNWVVYFSFLLIGWVVTFLTEKLVQTRLGEKAVGQLATSTSVVVACASVFGFGLNNYIIAEVGRRPQVADRIVRNAWGMRLLSFFPMTLAAYSVFRLLGASPTLMQLGYIAIGVGGINYLNEVNRSYLSGTERAIVVSIIDLVGVSVPMIALPFLMYGPKAVAFTALIAMSAVMLCVTFLIRTKVKSFPIIDFPYWREIAMCGLPFLMTEAISKFTELGSNIILRHYGGDASVGEFSRAMKLQGTCMSIPSSLCSAILPVLARLAHSDRKEYERLRTKSLSLVLILAIPVAIGLLILAHPFCRLLYGDKFKLVPAALQVAAVSLFPLYINTMLYKFLMAEKKNSIWSVFMLCTVVMNAVFCWVLVPITMKQFGNAPVGAILSSLISETIIVLFALNFLKFHPFTGETMSRLARALVAGLCMAASMWLVRNMFLVIPGIVGVIVFFTMMLLLRVLDSEEQQRIFQPIVRLLQRILRLLFR